MADELDRRQAPDALLALMCLYAARLPARVKAAGGLVPLDRQGRSRWDRPLIARAEAT